MKYAYTKEISLTFQDAVQSVQNRLSEEGFGVLFEIDVQKTMEEKLGAEYDKYIILGACNPSLANTVLQEEYEIGLLLPCNVIIYEKNDKVFASTVLPSAILGIVNNDNIKNTAMIAQDKLINAINKL